jgi:RNA polymerase sigma factor (sigma-70 family)
VRRYAVEAEKELNADYTQRLEDYEARKQAWVASQRSERRFTDANPKPKPPNSRDIIRRLQENAKQEPTTQRPTDGGWRGASKALRLLVEENEGLVKHVVSKAVKSYDQAWLNSRGLTNEELLSVARGKMLEALVRNDIEQYKTAFSTYPMICMKPSVSSYIQDRSANLALGAKRSVIKAALGPDSNLSAAEKKELAARVSPYVPLSKKHPEQNVMGPLTQRQLEVQEKLPQSLQQWLNNSDPVLPEDVVQQRQLREALERAITTKQEEVQKYPSNVKALEVLKRRYLDGLPLKEIAAQMGLKEGYASELSKIGLRLLRRAARNQRLLEFKGHLS